MAQSTVLFLNLFGLLSFLYILYTVIHFSHSLTQKHDGNYLANVVAQCLKRFGIEKKVQNPFLAGYFNYSADLIRLAVFNLYGQCHKL